MKVGKEEDNAHIAPIRVLIKAWKDTALKTESHATAAAAVTKTLAVHATGSSIAAPITVTTTAPTTTTTTTTPPATTTTTTTTPATPPPATATGSPGTPASPDSLDSIIPIATKRKMELSPAFSENETHGHLQNNKKRRITTRSTLHATMQEFDNTQEISTNCCSTTSVVDTITDNVKQHFEQ
eukprot:scaffold11747_cov294-Ochromonas_danica.AAC.1